MCFCELRFSLLLGVLYCADIGESGLISVLHWHSLDSLLGSHRMFSYLWVKIPVLNCHVFFPFLSQACSSF